MTTTMAPPVSLDGPIPVAPLHSLLQVPGIIVPVVDPFRFLGGGEIWPYPPGLPDAQDPCSTGTFRTKSEPEGWDLQPFLSYTLYLGIMCSSITAHAPGFYDRVRLAFQARESFGVASELARGTASNGQNPYLADGNLQILTAAAVAPDVALAYLERAIGATGQQGLIHAPPQVGAAWNGTAGGYQLENVTGTLRTTANGTPVALDGGYDGVQVALHAALPAGQSWAFATGPVAVRRDPDIASVGGDIAESMDRSINEVTFRAERGYLTTWDVQLQAGVIVDWTP